MREGAGAWSGPRLAALIPREWLPPPSWVYPAQSLLIDDALGIPPGGLWVRTTSGGSSAS